MPEAKWWTRIPDKLLAIGVFMILMGIYAWTQDDTFKQWASMVLGVVCSFFMAGQRRLAEAGQRFLDRRKGDKP